MTLNLQEIRHVDEPQQAQGYADVITRVIADGEAVIVRRAGADAALIIPVEFLDLLQDAVAREKTLEIARTLDWDRLVKENPPPQSWFDGDEPQRGSSLCNCENG
jgi:PHD/YefM family antitoxin component YafN of YafNO toxin-antitoxin module